MSFVFTQPQLLVDAATDLAGVGSALNAANTAAALPTTGVMAAGADEVSAAVASVFGAHAQQYQAMGAEAAKLHDQFVRTMNASSGAYADAEGANAKPLQPVEQAAQGGGARSLFAPPGSGGSVGAVTSPAARSIGLLPGNRAVTATVPNRGTIGPGGSAAPIGTGGAGGAAPVVGRRSGAGGGSGVITAGNKRTGRSFGAGGAGGVGNAADLGVTGH